MPPPAIASFPPGYPRTLFEERQLVYLLSRFKEGEQLPKSRIKVGENRLRFGVNENMLAEFLAKLIHNGWLSESNRRNRGYFGISPEGIAARNTYEERVVRRAFEAKVLFELATGKDRSRTGAYLDGLTVVLTGRNLLKQDRYRDCPKEVVQRLLDRKHINPGSGIYQSGFSIADEGLSYLTTLELMPEWKGAFSGAVLNALFAASRGVQASDEQAVEHKTPIASPRDATDLPQAIVDSFEKLKNEKYFRTGGVPIHEVRTMIRERCGDVAASHESFDPALKRMRSEGRFLLVAITMNPSVTQQQIDDSIAGINETLFFMEIAR